MINRLITKANQRWESWVKKRSHPGNPQLIGTRNLYILPTAFGWAYGVLVIILLIGAINYQNNMIFLLTFMLAIIGMVSACEAHGNILNMSIKFIEAEDTVAGSTTKVVVMMSADRQSRFGLYANFKHQQPVLVGQVPMRGVTLMLPVTQPVRGYFPLPSLMVSSIYPFAIFRVWSYAFFDEHVYVYPRAEDPGYWPSVDSDEHGNQSYTAGDDEFYDLKSVDNPWVDPKLIAWKIVAKGQGWFIRQMHSHEAQHWLFKWNDIKRDDVELTLSHFSYWLQAAEANGYIYGLEINETVIPFSQGREHLQQCLRQLAIYQ